MKLAVWVLTAVFAMALFGGFFESSSANFKPYAPPSIDISSPILNRVYNSSKVLLDVSATPVLPGHPNPIAYNNITSLNYRLDGQQDIRIPIGRSIYGIVLHEKFTFSNLSNGVHSVFVHGESTPFSIVPGYPNCSEKIPFNETVTFMVRLPGTSVSGHFPWIPVAVVGVFVAAVVAVIATVYLRKRRRAGGT